MKLINKKKGERGTITIETCVMLPIFFFVFLAIFGVFFLLLARHQMRHAFLQTAKSLSMDSYVLESVGTLDPSDGNVIQFHDSFSSMAIAFLRLLTADENWTAREKWYMSDNSATGQEIIRTRFLSFLAGGDEAAAEQALEALKVKDGLDGIEFEYTVSGGELELKMSYTLEYWFKLFGLEEVPMSHTVKMKMWGYDG